MVAYLYGHLLALPGRLMGVNNTEVIFFCLYVFIYFPPLFFFSKG